MNNYNESELDYYTAFLKALEHARNQIDFSNDEWMDVNNYIYFVDKRIEALKKQNYLSKFGDSKSENENTALQETHERIVWIDDNLRKMEQKESIHKLLSNVHLNSTENSPNRKNNAGRSSGNSTESDAGTINFPAMTPWVVRKAVEAGVESRTSNSSMGNATNAKTREEIIREKAKTLHTGERLSMSWRIGLIVVAVLFGWYDILLLANSNASNIDGLQNLMIVRLIIFIAAVVIGIIGIACIKSAKARNRDLMPAKPEGEKRRVAFPIVILVLLSIANAYAAYFAAYVTPSVFVFAIVSMLLEFLTISWIEDIVVNNAAIDFYNDLEGKTADSLQGNPPANDIHTKISNDEALQMLSRIQAEATIGAEKANEEGQPDHESDADFGLVPEKPIYTLAKDLVDGQKQYLANLTTTTGTPFSYRRRGSISIENVNGLIDVYDTFLPSGELYKTLYLNMYGARTSTGCPNGFQLSSGKEKPSTIIRQPNDSSTDIAGAMTKRTFLKDILPVIIISALLIIPLIFLIIALNSKSPHDGKEPFYFLSIFFILMASGVYYLTLAKDRVKKITGLILSPAVIITAIIIMLIGRAVSASYYTTYGYGYYTAVKSAIDGFVWSSCIIIVIEIFAIVLSLIIPKVIKRHHSSLGYKTRCYNKLARMSDLKDKGIISEEEYESIRKQITSKIGPVSVDSDN